jgi:ESCRT-I complex subunit TSG101
VISDTASKQHYGTGAREGPLVALQRAPCTPYHTTSQDIALTHAQEYQDPQRTYSDVAHALSVFPSLSPRTEVYTYEDGGSALLLTVSGTLPVDFRGATYRFPIKIWVPQAYTQESPMVYVTPGRDMLVRPGQHVGVEGRVYHPYLRDWSSMWDRANMADFLGHLQQAFAREPPLVSKAQQQQLQRPVGQQLQTSNGSHAGPPQLPPKQRQGEMMPVEMPSTSTPPPRPPRAGEESTRASSSRQFGTDGPPLPPLPGTNPQSTYQTAPNGYGTASPHHSAPSRQPSIYRNEHSLGQPPLPALPQHVQYEQQRYSNDRSPVSPISPAHAHTSAQLNRQPHSPLPSYQSQPQSYARNAHPQGPAPPQQPHGLQQQSQQPQHFAQHPHQVRNLYAPQNNQPAQQQPKKQPPPDLLSDPFEVALPANPGSVGPAPPIPPNPEREHLLTAISTSLVQQAQQKVHQNVSAVAPLQAQQSALRAAHARLEAEIAQLERLDATLSSNENILHRSIQDCTTTTSEAKSKKQPPIDEVLVAPTLVAQQLWTLTAEEAACREAMYVLQKAVDRGRISGSDFVRQMRGLGRESFLKMVLARKCARGLGLDADR